jgi:hypothetical protein
MISSGPNPHASRRCLPGRAYSTCAQSPPEDAAVPIATPDPLSESRFLLLKTALPLPSGILKPTFVFLQHQTATLETEQYPLKIDLRAKV